MAHKGCFERMKPGHRLHAPRLKVAGEKSGRMLLPVFYSDNYFSLLPGEVKEVDIRLYDADTYGEKPVLEVLGFNL